MFFFLRINKKGMDSDDVLIQCNEVEQKIHQKEVESKIDNEYKSCCLVMDKRALSFFSTLSISFTVIVFCIVKLSIVESCEEQNTYIGLLTLILGIWIRSPTFK